MAIKFSDLMELRYDKNSGRINIPLLEIFLPDNPQEIIRDLYSDHGREQSFQKQYSHIQISSLKWQKRKLKAKDIICCGCFPESYEWLNKVKQRTNSFPKNGWNCIDMRPEVVAHWQKFSTWIVPPIFIEKRLFSDENGYWLVEGHTRVGTLKGLVEQSVISPHSVHEIFFGDYRTSL